MANNVSFFCRKWKGFRQFPLPDTSPLDTAHLLALRALSKGKARQSLEYLMRVYDLKPRVTTQILLGLTYLHLKNETKAEKFLRPLTIFSSYAGYLMGVLRARQERWPSAALFLKKVIENCPGFSSAIATLSSVYLRKGEKESALKVVKEGIQKNPRNPGLYWALTSLLIQNDHRKEALRRFEEGFNVSFYNSGGIPTASPAFYPTF